MQLIIWLFELPIRLIDWITAWPPLLRNAFLGAGVGLMAGHFLYWLRRQSLDAFLDDLERRHGKVIDFDKYRRRGG